MPAATTIWRELSYVSDSTDSRSQGSAIGTAKEYSQEKRDDRMCRAIGRATSPMYLNALIYLTDRT